MTDHGKLHAGFRDAIHVPFIIVSCDTALRPADKVALLHNNKCAIWTGGKDEPVMWHGVVDPFRETFVAAGELFPVYIRKECFGRLRHDFEVEVHDRGGTETCHSVCNIF